MSFSSVFRNAGSARPAGQQKPTSATNTSNPSHEGPSRNAADPCAPSANWALFRILWWQAAKVRADVPLDVICCLSCAAATGVGSAIFTAKVEKGSSAVIFGLGGIGLNVVEGARIAGAGTIIGVDTNPEKEATARLLGVTHFLNPRVTSDVVGAVREITRGGADYAFECVGSATILSQAVESTRIGWGTTVTIGILPGEERIYLRPRALQEGRRLLGSYLGNIKTRTELPALADWYADGRLHLDDLISHRLELEDIAQGFAMLRDGSARRVVLRFQR
jgi:S-(hydroxymethyl)glutathione dehydrogenase / alcohol dehydrogenase